jgi:hypothetical protein
LARLIYDLITTNEWIANLENTKPDNPKNDTSKGDSITVGNVSGQGIVIGKGIQIGSINIDSLNKELQNVPSKYKNSLKAFSEKLNAELEKSEVPKERADQIQQSIVALGKEVEDVTPGSEGKLDYVKQTKVEAQTTDLIGKVLDALPPAAETIALFTPLNPFSKLIRTGLQKIVDAVKQSRGKA